MTRHGSGNAQGVPGRDDLHHALQPEADLHPSSRTPSSCVRAELLKFFRRHHRLALPFLPLVAEVDQGRRRRRPWCPEVADGPTGSARARRARLLLQPRPAGSTRPTTTWGARPPRRRRPSAHAHATGAAGLGPKGHCAHDRYLAISRVVQQRIQDTYGLNAPAGPGATLPHGHLAPAGTLDDVGDGEGFHVLVSGCCPTRTSTQRSSPSAVCPRADLSSSARISRTCAVRCRPT